MGKMGKKVPRGIRRGMNPRQAIESSDHVPPNTRKLISDGDENWVVVLYLS